MFYFVSPVPFGEKTENRIALKINLVNTGLHKRITYKKRCANNETESRGIGVGGTLAPFQTRQ